MNKWLEILVGLILIVAPIYVLGMNLWNMGNAAIIFLKGGIIWFFILIGLLFLLLGINDLKE